MTVTGDELDVIRPDHPVTLGELVRELGSGTSLDGDASVVVSGIHHDSRRVHAGDLFVARKGAAADGAKYVQDARNRGAAAVLATPGIIASEVGLPIVSVPDVMDGLARAASAIYGHPSFGLDVVGVTGTNGKTTTTHLVRTAIDAAIGAPSRCGIIGTVAHEFRGMRILAEHTTPEADDLARLMLAMKRDGATHVAMEVSSIALALGRTRAVRFAVAALTNVTQDHLDFHGDMASYLAAKEKLFLEYGPHTSVVCVDNDAGRELARKIHGPTLRVSASVTSDADIRPGRVHLSARGIAGEVRTPRGNFALRSPLVGAHNVENLMVALGCVVALGHDIERALAGLSSDLGAPGRLEHVDEPGDDIVVLVDYAHTPDALARVLDAVRSVTKGRVVCVFGCGGDRDPHKRGPMGAAVATRADVAIVTNDNPRTEDPVAIAEPVVQAMTNLSRIDRAEIASKRGFLVELDRAKAIEIAIGGASWGDVVVIAGKGHEDYQIIGTDKRHFDDREQARQSLVNRRVQTEKAR